MASLHQFNGCPADEEGSFEIHGQDVIPHGLGQRFKVLEVDEMCRSGVVDDDVESTEMLLAVLDHRAYLRIIGDITSGGNGLNSKLPRIVRGPLGIIFGPREIDNDIKTTVGQLQSGGSTDSGPSAGYESDSVLLFSHDRIPFVKLVNGYRLRRPPGEYSLGRKIALDANSV